MIEKRFNNFQEFLKTINLTDYVSESEIFILNVKEVSRSALREFFMYRNEFYEINLFKGVYDFRYAIDGTFYEPNGEPTLFFAAPDQLQSYEVMREYESYESVTGFLIYIHKNSFRQVEKSTKIHFFKREYKPYYTVLEQDYHKIMYWADLMHRESRSATAFKSQTLLNLLIILLLKTKEVVHEELSPLYGRPQEIIANFIDLIDKSHRMPKVSACASELALTPKKLNAITQQVLGKSANEVIKTQFDDKAKALLIQSELSIKEIAQELGFEEASNFSRFFKGINKISPVFYREQKGSN